MKNNPNKGEISNFNKIAKQLFPNWMAEQIAILTSKTCCDNEILNVTYDCATSEYVVTIKNEILNADGPTEIYVFMVGFPNSGGNPEIIAEALFNPTGKTLRMPGNLVTGTFTFVMYVNYVPPSNFTISTNKTVGVSYGFTSLFDSPITIPACP